MSLKTPESQAYAVLITKEIDPTSKKSIEFFLTEDEYQGIVAIMTNGGHNLTATMLDDGSLIALSDIRRIEVLPEKPKYNPLQLDTADPYRQADEEEKARMRTNFENFKQRLEQSGLLTKLKQKAHEKYR